MIEGCRKVSSKKRHPRRVSRPARKVREGFEQDKTPPLGVFSCSKSAGCENLPSRYVARAASKTKGGGPSLLRQQEWKIRGGISPPRHRCILPVTSSLIFFMKKKKGQRTLYVLP